jgi:histidine ammonia-lyase
MKNEVFRYGIDILSPGKAVALAEGELEGQMDAESQARINASQKAVASICENEKTVYGINTGFGPLCNTRIDKESTRLLQENILRSHSVGVGEAVPDEIVKVMLVTKIHALARGYSGISLKVIERLKWHLEAGVIPVVPSKGSVGASGDLAPLAHMSLPLIGPLITLSSLPRQVGAGGLHELDGRRVYVSRGVGVMRGQAPRIRFNAPPEVSLLTLE